MEDTPARALDGGGSFTCIKCATAKSASEFYPGPLSRSIYICRACHSAMNKDRRRSDPATRILYRARMRCKRHNVPVSLSVRELREMLKAEDPSYVSGDLLSCSRIRDDAPLCAGNVKLFRTGRLVE